MREYKYRARTKEGQPLRGLIEAENEESAAGMLIAKKLVPIEINDQAKNGFEIPFLSSKKISMKEKAIFLRQLSTMISAGLPLAQGLASLQEQSNSKRVKDMISQFMADIEGGAQLSEAFKGYEKTFTETDINIVAAGEASGKLDEVLKRIALQTENRNKTLSKVRNAFIYPVFLLFLVVGIMAFIILYVMPQMQELYTSFGDVKMPFLTRMIIAFSNFVGRYFILIAVLIVAIVVTVRVYIKTSSGKYLWDGLKLKVPMVNKFLTMSYMSVFSTTMESLIGAGVPILDALRIVGNSMTNVIFKEKIIKISDKVKAGQLLSTGIKESEIFPTMVPQMVKVGEQTGELDTMFKNLAGYYDEELENMTKTMQSLIEPVMIVVMGGIIGIIIVAVLLPIYNMGGVIKI